MSTEHIWEGRSKGTTTGYKIFIWLLRRGGLKAAYALLHLVTPYYRLFAPSAIRPLKEFYHRLGYNAAQTRKAINKNLIVFGQTLIDKIAILASIKMPLTFTHEGIEHLEQLVTDGKGGILISAHLGNWEVAGHLLQRVEAPINIVMYDGESDQIKAQMQQFDSQRSFHIITIKEDLSHIYELMAALNRNELICMHADRFRPGNRTLTHTFLGAPAQFPAGPFILASKLKAPVSFVFAFKESDFHYNFYATPIRTYEGRGTQGIDFMINDYVAELEKGVHQYPAQWFNYYDFWKS